MTTIESELFSALTEEFPAPWKLHYHEGVRYDERRYVAGIEAADGRIPLSLETHSGDGDMFYLRDEGAEALVKFVNAIHASK